MGEHKRRGYVLGKVPQVVIIPGRLDAMVDARSFRSVVPAHAKTIPVGGRRAEPGMQALINQ
jgi:hypothetical protein